MAAVWLHGRGHSLVRERQSHERENYAHGHKDCQKRSGAGLDRATAALGRCCRVLSTPLTIISKDATKKKNQ